MTVAELIAELQKYSPNLEVCFQDQSGEWHNNAEPQIVEAPWMRCLWTDDGKPMPIYEFGLFVALG